MSFGSRLRDKRNELNITQPQLAKMLGVSQSAVGSWETDVNSPRATLLYDLFDILHCDANYLFQDETRELYKNEATPEEFEKLVKPYRSLDPAAQSHVDSVLNWEVERSGQFLDSSKEITALKSQLSQARTASRFFAYYGRIAAAGTSVEFSGMAAGTKSFPESELNKNADYVIGVSGNSMEPEYYNGDIVYVQKTDCIEPGNIGIFQKGNSIYIKKAGEAGLISLNPDYPPLTPDGDRITVLGKGLGKAEE